MEDIRTQQKEALEVAVEYSARLEKAIQTIQEELRGQKKEDTQEYLAEIVKGFNWVLQVINGTMSLLQETQTPINKEQINQKVTTFSAALQEKNDTTIADSLEHEVLSTIRIFTQTAQEALENQ